MVSILLLTIFTKVFANRDISYDYSQQALNHLSQLTDSEDDADSEVDQAKNSDSMNKDKSETSASKTSAEAKSTADLADVDGDDFE